MLVKKYHDSHCMDKELLITIRKAMDASPDLRSKKDLIEAFIAGINDVEDILADWHGFVADEREKELMQIITEEKLSMIDRAEQFLVDKGFEQVRVRLHEVGDKSLARIEVTSDSINRLIDIREEVDSIFREIGFVFVTMDIRGYRTGAMNEIIN